MAHRSDKNFVTTKANTIIKVKCSESEPCRTHISTRSAAENFTPATSSSPKLDTTSCPPAPGEAQPLQPIPTGVYPFADMCLYRAIQHYKCGCKAENKLVKECIKAKLRGPCKDTSARVATQGGLSDVPYCEPCRNRELQVILDKGATREGIEAQSAAEQGATPGMVDEVRAKAREQMRAERLEFESMFPGSRATDRKAS